MSASAAFGSRAPILTRDATALFEHMWLLEHTIFDRLCFRNA